MSVAYEGGTGQPYVYANPVIPPVNRQAQIWGQAVHRAPVLFTGQAHVRPGVAGVADIFLNQGYTSHFVNLIIGAQTLPAFYGGSDTRQVPFELRQQQGITRHIALGVAASGAGS